MVNDIQQSTREKYPKKFRITATLRGPQDATVEKVKEVVHFACLALEIEEVTECEP